VQNVRPFGWKVLQEYWRRVSALRRSARRGRVYPVNLSEPGDTATYRNFDVVFCRNLLIYFDDISRTTAAETFYEALNPGVLSVWVIPNP